ncbi:MAG TPA: hypothetical protein ENJ56_00585 [Anaerolineae bacterium]|nr:hypothetical protein [Anaerolineae bacterium]
MQRFTCDKTLQFEFGAEWQNSVIEFDAADVIQKAQNSLPSTKAVDYLGIHRNKLYFIEVKDFRGEQRRIEQKNKYQTEDALLNVIACKVRDSVACLVGTMQDSRISQIWSPYKQLICQPQTTIKVIFWYEEDKQNRKRRTAGANFLSNQLKKKLKWLTTKVLVVDMQQSPAIDLIVSNVKREQLN